MQTTGRPRPRPSRACARCSRRKLGCDKVRPRCGRCARDGADCLYTAHSPHNSGAVTFIDETPNLLQEHAAGLSNRLQRLSEILAPPLLSTRTTDDQSEVSSGPGLTTPAEHDAGHLFLGAQTKSQYMSPTFFAMIREELSEIEALARSHRHAATSRTSIMSQYMPRTSFTGQTSDAGEDRWIYGDIFPRAPLHLSFPGDDGAIDYDSTLKQILVELPLLDQQNMLISAYMGSCHTVTPLFSRKTFLEQVTGLHSEYAEYIVRGVVLDDTDTYSSPSSTFAMNPHFLALLTAILFAGAVVVDKRRLIAAFPHLSREALMSQLFHLAIRAIRVSGFPHSPSLHSLAAYLTVNTAWLRDEDPLACCAFIGTAFRVAQMLGLHRDPTNFPEVSLLDGQIRRQIWFSVVAVDAQVAFASGLPPLIENKLYRVAPISETSGLDLQDNTNPTTRGDSVVGIFVAGKNSFYCHASEFMHILHSNRITQEQLREVLSMVDSIQTEMNERIGRIREADVAVTGPSTPIDPVQHPASNPRLARFASIVLTMLAAKPFAIMYGPLRKHRLLDSVPDLRARTIMHCRKYLIYFLILTQRPYFQPWHWRWPGQHQPLHSIMALITHLEEFPADPLAPETRRLVDLAFQMCRNDAYGGIAAVDDRSDVFGGGAAASDRTWSLPQHRGPWNLVRSARDRVWEKAGLDSGILVCPTRVDQISFAEIEMPSLADLGPDMESDVGAPLPPPTSDPPSTGNDPWLQFLPDASSVPGGGDWDFLNQLSQDSEAALTAMEGSGGDNRITEA